ncbi:P-loop containing nucleoside triphosphate hydrolase protein [Neolentinus lepideus HHB14362 ss-1]|uniref:p-loop containing nucleoside triphosphate hydrolase protein n=1 Tax=Neolentinus lepideus HHB14362 ss-1 TaxID=1314782 RepID=A0A165RDQ1_9AGAM|nr:P-loop containing nucleoside triphosphate hydrolase protein [Neolentinus lepideus HHB14362 ss-1]
MLSHIPFPALPAPPSWYPGHMDKFARMLPALLRRTDVVLELRDSRLPLTSINETLEGAVQKWRRERGRVLAANGLPAPVAYSTSTPCERIVVFNKRDLVPEWGLEPFRRAMLSKFPDQRFFFASWHRPRDIKTLNEMLVSIAKEHPHAPELNVLVVGMPNVGKSTLLNALRNIGIPGPTAKALRTSSQPGLTRAISTRLKLSIDPLVYAYDSPGVMLPFLGRGERGAERGVKLALIAGIKEGLYDVETLAAYLLYRLNVLNPRSPAYLQLLPEGATATADVLVFLEQLATRLGMLKRGGERDVSRAATWFVKWWRDEGGLKSASVPLSSSPQVQERQGWGFDFEWTVDKLVDEEPPAMVQRKMEECIDRYVAGREDAERRGAGVSSTQEKKKARDEKIAKRMAKTRARFSGKR